MSKKPGLTRAVLTMKCPQCREGELFKKPGLFVLADMATMHQHCPVCGLKYEQEPGFWWGAMYVSYGLAVSTALPAFIIFYWLLDMSFRQSMLWVFLLQVFMVPSVFRLSRSIWIYMLGNYKTPRS